MKYMFQVPMVIRGPGGVGRQLGAEHSQRLESYFQSIPGVQLVACSTAANAKALLKSAIRSDNPIIFFEHVLLYNVKGAPWQLSCITSGCVGCVERHNFQPQPTFVYQTGSLLAAIATCTHDFPHTHGPCLWLKP